MYVHFSFTCHMTFQVLVITFKPSRTTHTTTWAEPFEKYKKAGKERMPTQLASSSVTQLLCILPSLHYSTSCSNHSNDFIQIPSITVVRMLSRIVRRASSTLSRSTSVASASKPNCGLVSAQRFINTNGANSNSSRNKSTASSSVASADEVEDYSFPPELDLKVSSEVPFKKGSDGDSVLDYTSGPKSGTPSPWAVFDAWGAGSDILDPLSPEEEKILSPSSVKIPTTEAERENSTNETDILQAYDHFLKSRSSVHFGYPYNLMYNHEELYPFMRYSINNLGDPFVQSNYGVHSRQFECSVIDFFANLWNIKEGEYWGYVTTCGTEGNLHGILLARECHPNGILYSSKETHYSIFKAARYYRMDSKAIPTLATGEIDYDILASEIAKNKDRPVIINVNIGTTVKGAVDNLDRILRILNNLNIPRERFHIHCDGALFAMMMPFVDFAPEISFKKPIDSIAVSGHKMLGCPMPCGVALARKEHVKKVEQRIDYLNSVDTTIMGSRNGQAALYMWYSLRKKGVDGIKRDVV